MKDSHPVKYTVYARLDEERRILEYKSTPDTEMGWDKSETAWNEDGFENSAAQIFNILTQQAASPTADAREQLERAGKDLYNLLITAELGRSLRDQPEDSDLILVLANELLWIPWELLYDATSTCRQFLCQRFRLIRRLEKSVQESKAVRQRIHAQRTFDAFIVLGNTDNLKPDREKQWVSHALDKIYTPKRLSGLKTREVLSVLTHDPEVLHFIGHGEYRHGDREQTGWVCKDGLLSQAMVEDLPSDPLFPLLIFANSCNSAHLSGKKRRAEPADHESEKLIGNLSIAFAKKGVPFYIGTLAYVSDAPSAAFAKVFYERVGDEATVGQALRDARLRFLPDPGCLIWAYYVCYGHGPTDFTLVTKDRTESLTVLRLSEATQRKRKRLHAGLIAAAILLAVLVVMFLRKEYAFPGDTFGVAVAALSVKDITRATDRTEALFSPPELSRFLTGFFAQNAIKIVGFEKAPNSHEEARQWGQKRNAQVVIWGSADRGSAKLVVHVKGTRIAIPEASHQKETFKRFFLYMLFKDQFRDERSYITDFDLGDLTVDLADPKAVSLINDQAALLTGLLRGVTLFAEGSYSAAESLLRKIVEQRYSPEVSHLARRWLVLSHLNAREYESALNAFSTLASGEPATREDVIRFAFLRLCYERFVRGVLPNFYSDWVKPLKQGCVSPELSADLKSLCAAMLAEGTTGADVRERVRLVGATTMANLGQLARSAASESPNSYFPLYVLAMVTMDADEAEEALRKLEKLNPKTSISHFGRAQLLSSSFDPVDYLAALDELTRAIAAEPAEMAYWRHSLTLLGSVRTAAIGRTAREMLMRQIALLETFRSAPRGEMTDRAVIGQLLVEIYADGGETGRALQTLKDLVNEFPQEPRVCAFAAVVAMRRLGAFREAEAFYRCMAKSAVVSPESAAQTNRVSAELQWREGDFGGAASTYIQQLFRDAWKSDPGESLAVLDVVGNIHHAAGRYEDAERLLRAAKSRALTIPDTGVGSQPLDVLGTGPDVEVGVTLRESDYKWKWATTFDLGLVFLSRGDYGQALHQFEESLDVLYAFTPRFKRPKNKGDLRVVHSQLVSLTRLCEGYAYFNQGNREAARQMWWSVAYPTRYIHHRSYSEVVNDIERLRREIQDDPYRAKVGGKPTELVRLLVALNKHRQAVEFIETNELQHDFTPALLYLYTAIGASDKVEATFRDLVQFLGGTTKFAQPLAALASSLEGSDQRYYESWQWYDKPDFLLSVIATNPYTTLRPRLDLTTWRDEIQEGPRKRDAKGEK